MAEIQEHVIDDEGDVILVLGEPPVSHIKVSSKILSVASKPLRALLSDKFKEGQQLIEKKNGRSGPAYVELPEDDKEAMLVLCQVLHFRKVEGCPSINLLNNVAILCDKYDCSQALHFASSTWLAAYLPFVDQPNHEGLLADAYLFKNPAYFQAYTKRLITTCSGTFDQVFLYGGGDVLPAWVKSKLRNLLLCRISNRSPKSISWS